MKKILRILGLAVLAVLLALALLATYIYFSPAPTYAEVAVPELTVEVTPARVLQGRGLVQNNCYSCHHGENSTQLTGRLFDDRSANKDFGAIYTSIITQDANAAIAGYTDGELDRLLRTGVKKNNAQAIAVMPTWPLAADEDIYAIIAFLRSDHPMVAAAEANHPLHQPSFLERALRKLVFRPVPYQDEYPTRPALSDSIAYGAYQVNAVNLCYYCHSADIKAANPVEPTATPGYLVGGFVFPMLKYDIEVPNLLSAPGTSIGDWTVDEFVTAVKYGLRPNKPAFQEPMHPYLLDSSEIRAVYQYLASVAQQ